MPDIGMSNNTIWPIELDEYEQNLFNDIKAYPLLDIHEKGKMGTERTGEILQSSYTLTQSLRKSKKIPISRIKYFESPDYNIQNRNRSKKENFENNGTKGEDIYKHVHFIPYLIYFVDGASVSDSIKYKGEELIVKEYYKDKGCDEFFSYLKSSRLIPKDLNSRNTFSEEIFKLAIDANCDLFTAIRLRNSIKNKR